MEVKLGTHMYFSVSMTTTDKKLPRALFPTSSLLKLAQHIMHGGETWYTYVFQCFHDNHEQITLGTFSLSSLLKLANHAMHGSETWYACRYHDNRAQKWPRVLFDQERLVHFSNLQTIECKVTLKMHVHFRISMMTMNQKWPQALFSITTSSPFNTYILHTASPINT